MATLKDFSPDFGKLAKIPEYLEESRGLAERKESLSDLDSNDPDSMERTARRLFATGNTKNMELGLRLQQAAQTKRMGMHQISEAEAGREALRMLPGLLGGGEGPAPGPAPPPAMPGMGGC